VKAYVVVREEECWWWWRSGLGGLGWDTSECARGRYYNLRLLSFLMKTLS
jgi:hypothetical protein